MLAHRLLFGSLMIALLLGLFYLDDRLDELSLEGTVLAAWFGRDFLPAGLLMLGLFLAVIILVARELCEIFHAKGIGVSWSLVAVSGVSGLLIMYGTPQDTPARYAIAIMATVMFAIFMLALLRYSWAHARTEGAVIVAAATMLAFLYLGVLPGLLIGIRRYHSAWIVLGVILTVKSCDIGAFFTGRAIGRHRLIPWLSPGKTWEGLLGGLVTAGVVAGLLVWLNNTFEIAGIYLTDPDTGERTYHDHRYPVFASMLAGVILGAVGQLGDLTASLFKRDAGIKDSGRSIPGFGGLLDVIDSPIVVAPIAYWMLVLAAQTASG